MLKKIHVFMTFRKHFMEEKRENGCPTFGK
jgi:hypothetical protein